MKRIHLLLLLVALCMVVRVEASFEEGGSRDSNNHSEDAKHANSTSRNSDQARTNTAKQNRSNSASPTVLEIDQDCSIRTSLDAQAFQILPELHQVLTAAVSDSSLSTLIDNRYPAENDRPNMDFVSSSSPSSAQASTLSDYSSFSTSKSPTKTSSMTDVHHLGSIQTSIRSRLQFVERGASEKKAPLAKVQSTLVAAEVSSTEENEVHSIFDKFSQELDSIESERSTNIQAAENKANAAQALVMRRGMGMAVSYGIEEDKKRAVSDIEKIATHQRNILFLRAKGELLEHQKTYFKSLFETYSPQSSSSTRPAPTLERCEQCQQMIHQAFEIEQQFFAELGDLKQADEPTITAAIKTVTLADTIRMRALYPFVEHSINTSLDQIDETSTLIHTLSQSKNKFLNTEALATFHEELNQQHANYLLAEALFNGTAKEAAVNNASYLQTKIQELNLELKRTYLEKTTATLGNQVLLGQKISLLTTLSIALETAQQAYRRIADNASLKIKIPITLPNNSIELPAVSDGIKSPALNKARQSLSALVPQTAILSRTTGLNLLSRLSDFTETEDNHAIFGRRGEIELLDENSLSFVSNAKLAQEGINLIRLAVFRDFGARGLERFDAYFHDKIVALESPDAQNFLTIRELKEFIYAEDQINPSAFYLSSIHPIAELVFEEDPVDESKFIKADGSSSFNPFAKTSPSKVTLSTDQETVEGRTATRAALKEFFKDLPEEVRQSILNRFDEKFKTSKTPLTVREVRSFLKKEIENLKAFNLDVAGPFLYSLVWHIGTTSLWTFMMSAHPPAWAMMMIGLGLGVGHDLTSYWRQLRPEDER